MVDIVFALRHLPFVHPVEDIWLLGDGAHDLVHNDEFLAGNVEFLDGFTHDFLVAAVGVDVREVPGVEACSKSSLSEAIPFLRKIDFCSLLFI